jgi:hypothetical protein
MTHNIGTPLKGVSKNKKNLNQLLCRLTKGTESSGRKNKGKIEDNYKDINKTYTQIDYRPYSASKGFIKKR